MYHPKKPCLEKILLSQAAVLAYYSVLVLIGFHVGKQHLLKNPSFLGQNLRGCRSIHIQNVSFVVTEEVAEVQIIEAQQGENEDSEPRTTATSVPVASSGASSNNAPSMEDDAFSFDVDVAT